MEFEPNEEDDDGYVSPDFDLSHLESSDDDGERMYNPNKVSKKHKKQRVEPTATAPIDLEALALRALGK